MKLYTVNISYNYRWIEYLTRRFSGRKSRAAELFVIRMKIDFLPLIILLDVKEKKLDEMSKCKSDIKISTVQSFTQEIKLNQSAD